MTTISVIVTHWAQNDLRSETMRTCVLSLINTTKDTPCEIIVVDNGESYEDSVWLLQQVNRKNIHHYIRNSENLYFGYARNQAIKLSMGDYIVVSDNDIEYKPGWIEECVKILEAFPEEKLLVTPLKTDREHRSEKYWRGIRTVEGKSYLLNARAGSNSWMMRRETFEEVGRFVNHRIAGSKWIVAANNKGYNVVTMETEPLAVDMGFTKGYNFKETPILKKVLTDGSEVILNEG